jgi:hypothetical protein
VSSERHRFRVYVSGPVASPASTHDLPGEANRDASLARVCRVEHRYKRFLCQGTHRFLVSNFQRPEVQLEAGILDDTPQLLPEQYSLGFNLPEILYIRHKQRGRRSAQLFFDDCPECRRERRDSDLGFMPQLDSIIPQPLLFRAEFVITGVAS